MYNTHIHAKKKMKCYKCQKKLKIVQEEIGKCKCGYTYCPTHRHNHVCYFDYTAENKKQITAQNPSAQFVKVEAI